MDKPYNDLSLYCIKKYGRKLYKLSLSIANTCPNRDGTLSHTGCIFCSGRGSGDFAEDVNIPVTEQIKEAKKRIEQKTKNIGDLKYIAYFQSFTSTYLPGEILYEKLYDAAIHPDIEVISIATRPDCLGKDILDVLQKINKIKPVWVELGLQSSSDKTAKIINRGYETTVFDMAVKNLQNMNIEVIAHIIIGLPYETETDLLNTINHVNSLKLNGVKLQLLHVLENTPLAKMNCTVLSLEEYAHLLCLCISHLSPDIVIHRISGDGNKKELIAPLWSADKKRVLNYLAKYMKENGIKQGYMLSNSSSE